MLADDQTVYLQSAPTVLVYRDALNTTLFYYASTRPAVARGGGGEYQLTLVHYDEPIDGNAGMLSLVVNLQPNSTEMDNMRRELAGQYSGASLQFLPVPWTAGKVAAAMIDGSSVFGTPSLLGDNSVVLSIPLTSDQYLLLRKSARNPPLSVVYGLSYEAFRPKYGFSVQFDESKFRDWVQKKCSANFLFISVEKTETFEDLLQSGVVRVNSENQTGEEPPEGFRKAFLQSLQSILVPLPRFAPGPEADTGNWLIGFNCSTVRDVQNISKRLDTNMMVTGVVARQAFIQGAVTGLSEALAARPDVELPTRVSFTQSLTVRCHDAFDGKPLDSINVKIDSSAANTSPQTVSTHLFASSKDEWATQLVHAPGSGSKYSYRCNLYFRDGDSKGVSNAADIRYGQAFLDVVPSEIYTYRRYEISVAKEFPWDLLKSRSIRLALSGPEPLRFEPAHVALSEGIAPGAIEAFSPVRTDLNNVVVTATYNPAVGPPFTLVGSPAGASIFLNPFSRRVVTFRVAEGFDWQDTTRIVITVCPSADNPQLYGIDRPLLTRDVPQTRFTYWYSIDRKLRYQATLSRMNGQQTQIQPADTLQAEVIVSEPVAPSP